MRVLLAHPGTQYSFRLAVELQRRDSLSAFHTGLAFCDDGWVDKVWSALPANWQHRTANRRIEGLPSSQLHLHPVGELDALLRFHTGEKSEVVIHERNKKFQQLIPEKAIATAQAVVGFDTSAWLLADRCRKHRLPFILDQSIGHPKAKEVVFDELRSRFPKWVETIPRKSEGLLACESTEHSLATIVVAPSNFVRQTLIENGVVAEKIRVIPFGTDLELFSPALEPGPGPRVFLYAGSITARKGVPVLLEAWDRAGIAGRAELWLAGPGRLPPGVNLPEGAKLLGPLSRSGLAATMRRSDVFVFPSFFEGLAQVQIEALAAGLPLIGTTASGAEDIVIEGETGFVTAPDDHIQLALRMQQLAEDTSGWSRMRDRCVAGRERFAWAHYGDRWADVLQELGLLPREALKANWVINR